MRHTYFIKMIPMLVIIVFFGFTVPAVADWGMGYGQYQGWGHPMHGMHHGGYGGPGFGYWNNLSTEDLQKMEKERFTFFETTQDLRSEMYQKSLELRSELAKKNPDIKKAAGLQKEISKIKAEFDQKHLNHFLKMKKINPDMSRGFGGRYGMMGPGMMGRGGYGMGPGMMGPGMMGAGGEYAQRYGGHMGSLEEKDARNIVENYIRSTRNPNLKIGKIVDSGNAYKAQITTREDSLVEEVLIDKANGSMRSAY